MTILGGWRFWWICCCCFVVVFLSVFFFFGGGVTSNFDNFYGLLFLKNKQQ